MATVADFNRWLRSNLREPFEYYRGFLMRDRLIKARRTEAVLIAGATWYAHQMGAVSLVQRRIGDGVFAYIAQRRK